MYTDNGVQHEFPKLTPQMRQQIRIQILEATEVKQAQSPTIKKLKGLPLSQRKNLSQNTLSSLAEPTLKFFLCAKEVL